MFNTNDRDVAEPTRPVRRSINVAVGVYWLSMFVGTHIPNPDAIISPNVSDKLLHFGAYFTLSLLLSLRIRALCHHWPSNRELCQIAGVCVVYAVLDEVLQAIPMINRHADPLDALADVTGAATAILCILVATRFTEAVKR